MSDNPTLDRGREGCGMTPTIANARHTARRLRAAARSGGINARRAAEIGHRLAWARRHSERVVVTGPYAHLSEVHCFLRDWRHAIDAACRSFPGRLTDAHLHGHAKAQRTFERQERRAAHRRGEAL